MTPAGRLLPLGAKQNKFTRCMSDELKGNLNTGKNLSQAKLDANKATFFDAVETCKTPKPVRKAPAKK